MPNCTFLKHQPDIQCTFAWLLTIDVSLTNKLSVRVSYKATDAVRELKQ